MKSRTCLLFISLVFSAEQSVSAAPPAPPGFPFSQEIAASYQRDFAKSISAPLEVKTDHGITLVLVPPGTFVMGSPDNEMGRQADERQHRVTLTKPIYLAKHEVTVGQFRQFVEANKYVTDVEKNKGGNAHDEKANWEHHPGTHWKNPGYAGKYTQRDDHPVVHVSHTDAVAFCAWLSKSPVTIDGVKKTVRYRLPTEAEFEWACRAGSGSRFWWGEDEDTSGKVANVGDDALKRMHPLWPRTTMKMDDGHAYAAPVGSYRANSFGLHDILGNVWEFCSSRHGSYPSDPTTDPGDLSKAEGYSVRGGGWSNVAADCRCATRNSDPPHFGHSNLGFRVVAEIPER